MRSNAGFPGQLEPQGLLYSWPDGVAKALGVSVPQLQRQRAQGDSPKLYAISERKLVTTAGDLLAWVRAKEVPPGYKCRRAVRGAGQFEAEQA